eukprot:gene20359-24384_t
MDAKEECREEVKCHRPDKYHGHEECWDGILRPISQEGIASVRYDAVLPPGPGSHASNIIYLHKYEALLLSWCYFATNQVVVTRRSVTADRWSRPVTAASEEYGSAQNSVLFYDEQRDVVTLLYTSQGGQDSGVHMVTSSDGGATWGSNINVAISKSSIMTKNHVIKSKSDQE